MKNLLQISLAIALLVGAGCQRTENVVPKDDVSKRARISATTVPTGECDVISFTSASGLITSVTSEKGVVVDVESHNPRFPSQPEAAMIFNSSSPYYLDGEDLDLGTPGFGNNADLGNIVVIQNFSSPYLSTTPNDDDVNGALLEFIFPQPVTVNSIQTIDVESNEDEGGVIKLLDANGTQIGADIAITPTGANGVGTINLGGVAGVKTISITINGSMGFDNISFCVPTPPPGEGCTHTQGYWKNHPDAWDVPSLSIGGTTYNKATLITVLKTEPKKGNSILKLAHQLIAAKLNVEDGAAASPAILAAIAQADQLLSGINITSPGDIKSDAMNAVASLLDSYNNGNEGTEHCDD